MTDDAVFPHQSPFFRFGSMTIASATSGAVSTTDVSGVGSMKSSLEIAGGRLIVDALAGGRLIAHALDCSRGAGAGGSGDTGDRGRTGPRNDAEKKNRA
jgi:hypothetical protein